MSELGMHSVVTMEHGATPSVDDSENQLVIGGRRTVLSPEVAQILGELVSALEAGRTIEIRTVDEYLSTQEVAEILGISRPSVVRLLDKGLLEYDQPAGVHRRVSRSALMRYREAVATERRAALQELAETYTPQDAELDGYVSTR